VIAELDRQHLGVDGRSVDLTLGYPADRLFERLAVGSRTELASGALRDGWLDVPA
jgi:hypothetical protein